MIDWESATLNISRIGMNIPGGRMARVLIWLEKFKSELLLCDMPWDPCIHPRTHSGSWKGRKPVRRLRDSRSNAGLPDTTVRRVPDLSRVWMPILFLHLLTAVLLTSHEGISLVVWSLNNHLTRRNGPICIQFRFSGRAMEENALSSAQLLWAKTFEMKWLGWISTAIPSKWPSSNFWIHIIEPAIPFACCDRIGPACPNGQGAGSDPPELFDKLIKSCWMDVSLSNIELLKLVLRKTMSKNRSISQNSSNSAPRIAKKGSMNLRPVSGISTELRSCWA